MLPPNKHNKKRNHKRNQRIPEKSDIPNQANFKEGAGATTHFTSCEPHPTPQPAAQPSIEPPRQTSIMAPDSALAQADWAASEGPFFSDRRLWPSGSRAQPWSLFAFFLSIQKEGPRRRGGRRDVLKTTEKGTERTQPPHSPNAPSFKINTFPRRVRMTPCFCSWEQMRATWIREAFTAEARFSWDMGR